MFAQINHIAIISPRYPLLGKFYEAVFGLKPPAKSRPVSAVTIGDGYTGLNLIPRRDGYVEGIDHFGMLVDEIVPVRERMLRKFPGANLVQRPSARPFAAYSGHDPDGNVFDLAQREADTRKEIYAEIAMQAWAQDRYLNRFAIRTPNAEQVAEFLINGRRRMLAEAGDSGCEGCIMPRLESISMVAVESNLEFHRPLLGYRSNPVIPEYRRLRLGYMEF